MKKPLKILFILIAVFLFGDSYFAQKSRSQKPPKKQVITVSGTSDTQMNFLGTVEGKTYKNKFFGVKLILPEEWLIQESQINDAIKQVGAEMVKGKTSQTQKAYDSATQRLAVLLTTSKDILGIENNATLIFSAEKSAPLVQIRNGQDYLRLNIQTFKKLKLPADFKYSETISAEKFGNETFYYIQVDRATYRQRFYAIYRKGYSLFFTLSYASNEDLETMKKVIRDSDFSWKE
jgi:hypothetical protein